MGFGQYDILVEYCGLQTASSVTLIVIWPHGVQYRYRLISWKCCYIIHVLQHTNQIVFKGHYFDIKNHNDTTVSRHFNNCPSPNPTSYGGLEISILSFIKNPANSRSGQLERDREEKRWIHRLAKVVPKGLNLMD